MADYVPTLWVDDDGSNVVGTPFDAAHMNKIEQGIVAAGSALPKPTANWNLAVTPFSWRSLNADEMAANGFQGTVNGPGDPLNPPDAVGYTLVQDSQIIQVAFIGNQPYIRYKQGAGAWTAWIGMAMPPVLQAAPVVGGNPPYNGEERMFQNAAMLAAGVMWRFRYNSASASAYKWEFIGGSELRSEVGAASVNTVAYGDFGGPSVVVGVAGDYVLSFGAAMAMLAGENGYIAPVFSAAAASDGDAVNAYNGAGNPYADSSRSITRTVTAAGFTVKVQSRVSVASGRNFANRWLSVRPVRVALT